uniref:PxGV-Corf5 protein n=1 Tax=Plutella xylostella granulovirus TaxID=98383 RepID=A0A142DVJ9_9BBAC|nr:PxGV-Corf5 protein [Plutella xylostella granulovirus]
MDLLDFIVDKNDNNVYLILAAIVKKLNLKQKLANNTTSTIELDINEVEEILHQLTRFIENPSKFKVIRNTAAQPSTHSYVDSRIGSFDSSVSLDEVVQEKQIVDFGETTKVDFRDDAEVIQALNEVYVKNQ